MPSKITPPGQTKSWNRIGSPPAISNLVITIDEFSSPVTIVQFAINFEGTSTEWLNAPDNPYGYITHDGSTGNLQLFLQNLDLLANGTYKANIIVDFMNDDGLVRTLNAEIYLILSGLLPTQITTDKLTYNVVYNRDNDTLTGDSLVSIVNNTDPILLKFWQNSEVFAPAENFTNSFTLAEDSGNPFATNTQLPETGNFALPAKILRQTGEFISGFTINLLVIDGGIFVQPEKLDFEVFKAPGYEKSQTLSITNPLGIDFEVTAFPDWLTLDSTSGNTDKTITVTTNTSTKSLGKYTGIIKFEFNDKFIDVPVTLDLKGFIIIDETKDFCLDLPEVIISKKTAGANFVKIKVTATYTVLGIAQVFEKTYLQAYFKNKVLFGLGEKLHRHFPRIKKHFFDEDETVIMQKINATIKVEELDINRTAVFEQTVSNIKLFPGKKPTAYPLLSSAIYRKKNANAILFTSKVDGNHVDLKITDVSDLPSQVSFYDFPKTYAPVHVQWENQNLCPEWFTFTGDYKITPDFNHIYARNIFNAQNEKYDVTKVKTLTINTGLFLSKERALMTEIIESKLSFLKIEGKIYRAFNITKKNVEVDSTEELIARDLEFIIVE